MVNLPQKEVIKKFTTSQNWAVPAGVTKVDVYLVSGGQNGARGKVGIGGTGGSGVVIIRYYK